MSSTAEETSPVASTGTGEGLIAFLNWTIRKNELVDTTASALRTGCQKVLSVEEDPNGVDLRTADLDNIVSRFRNRHRSDMKDRTLEQYAQRFRQSVEMYIKWLDNDPTWKPVTRKRATGGANGSGNKSSSPTATRVFAPPAPAAQLVEPHQPGMITYPFPIRPGLQGAITLPEDLTAREAKRVAAFIAALALEDEPEPRALRAAEHFHQETESP